MPKRLKPVSERYAYSVKSVRHGYVHNAMRAGVFNPLYGRGWLGWKPNTAYSKLRKLWQARLMQLRDAGWPWAETGKNYAYALNCPPFGVVCSDVARYCRKLPICPFCYARRYLRETYLDLERLLFGTREEPHEPQANWRLFEFNLIRRLRLDGPHHEDLEWNEENKLKLLEAASLIVKRDRRVEYEKLRPWAGVVLHRLEYYQGEWPIKRSGLFLCTTKKAKLDLPEPPRGQLTYRTHANITRRTLASAVARAFAFPKTVFLTEPDDVLLYLHRFHGTRMLARYGKMRNEHGEEND